MFLEASRVPQKYTSPVTILCLRKGLEIYKLFCYILLRLFIPENSDFIPYGSLSFRVEHFIVIVKKTFRLWENDNIVCSKTPFNLIGKWGNLNKITVHLFGLVDALPQQTFLTEGFSLIFSAWMQ